MGNSRSTLEIVRKKYGLSLDFLRIVEDVNIVEVVEVVEVVDIKEVVEVYQS